MMRRGDAGTQHVLEVTVVLCLMFGTMSVLSVTTNRDAADARLETLLQNRLRDSFFGWIDSPDTNTDFCQGENLLERMAQEGLQGDSSTWNAKTFSYRPAHDVDLVLENSAGHIPLQGSGRVIGTSVSQHWDVLQTYLLPVMSVNAGSGLEATTMMTPLVSWGHLSRLEGEAIRYSIDLDGALTVSTKQIWSPSALLPYDEANRVATQVAWVGLEGEPDFVDTIGTAQTRSEAPDPVTLVLKIAPSGAPIPEGTTVTVIFPVGWRTAEWYTPTMSPWIDTSPPMAADSPIQLRAQMGPSGGESQELTIEATAPSDPIQQFDTITAQLSNGSLSESSIVLRYGAIEPERNLPLTLYPTTPYPVALGQQAYFGLAIANGGAEAVNVTQVDIEIPGGYDFAHNNGEGAPLFAAVEAVSPSEGWSFDSPKLLRWSSEAGIEVPAFSAEQFVVKATITSDPAVETAIEPAGSDGPNITLAFGNDYITSGTSWGKSPGIVTIRVPPASKAEDTVGGNTSDGYPWPTVPAVGGEDRSFIAYGNDTMAHLRTVGEYTVSASSSDLVNLETAIANATFEVQQRKVPVGTTMWVEGDFESLVTSLQQLGVASSLTLDLYAPPSLGCAPTASWDVEVSDLPGSGVSAVLVRDIGGVPAALVGSEDGYLYRVGLTGAPVWGTQLAGMPTALATIQTSGGDDYILAGTSGGKLQWLNAEDGSLVHTESVVVGAGTTGIAPVAEVVTDGTQVFAAAGTDLVRFGELGGEVAGHEFLTDIVDIAAADGEYYVLTVSELFRATSMLAPTSLAQPPLPTMGGVGLAVSDDLVLVAWDGGVEARDRVTNAQVAWRPSEHTITLAAEGSATDDSIVDLVYARSDSSLWAMSGADGSLAWWETNIAWNQFGGIEGLLPPEADDQVDCVPLREPASYITPVVCGGSTDDGPLALTAGGGAGVVALPDGAGSRLLGRDDGGVSDWDDYGGRVDVLASGTWLGAPAYIAGDSAGTVRIYPTVGEPVEMQASERVGRFSVPIHVPLGGFFGSNLVVATLSWEVGSTPMEAKLVDWFEVVAPDGSVVDNPIYTLGLTASQRDRPVESP